MTLSPHGIGQALIYPYYTVNKDQDTLISVTNVSDVGKAIQVRFREGWNGRDALSFVLFLGAHDTWTAAVTANDEGAVMHSSDSSCLSSALPPEGAPFRTAAFDESGLNPPDGGPQDLSRTREGFFEMIVGGDVIANSPTDHAMHPTNGGVPQCPIDANSFVVDLEDPTKDGIYGSATIVNVANGTFFGYNADALQGIADDVLFLEGNPYPGPELTDASNNQGVRGTARAYITTGDGHGLAVDYSQGIDAVSAVFMADAIYNDYIVAESLGAATDWVLTFPTKQFYVDGIYGNVPRPPFKYAFEQGWAPVEIQGGVFDREQHYVPFEHACDTNCPSPILPFQVNVIGVGGFADDFTSRVLGSTLNAAFMPAVGDAGNALISLTPDGTRILGGGIDAQHGEVIQLHGLPVTGFMVYNVVNSNATPSVLANYSGTFPHRRSVNCEGGTFGCPVYLNH